MVCASAVPTMGTAYNDSDGMLEFTVHVSMTVPFVALVANTGLPMVPSCIAATGLEDTTDATTPVPAVSINEMSSRHACDCRTTEDASRPTI